MSEIRFCVPLDTKCLILETFPPRQSLGLVWKSYKSSAVAEMGDRGHNRHGLERGSPLKQCGLGPALLPYQVASSFIPQFGHNRQLGAGGCATFRGAGTPSNTTSPAPTPTSILSGILVRQAVWPQRTWAQHWGLCPFRTGGTASPPTYLQPQNPHRAKGYRKILMKSR